MIRRAERKQNFSVISNMILRDDRLSWKARGLAAFILSQPDNWNVNERHLAKQAPDGITAVRSALKELEEYGFLLRTRKQGDDGKFVWESVISDEPCSGYPRMDNPCVDNLTLINTIERSTIERNTNVAQAQPSSTPKRKSGDPRVKAILDAYVEVRGKNGIHYGKEGTFAKKIVNDGGTPDEVKGCYLWLKADPFWEDKPLSLSKIFETLPEYTAMLERKNLSTVTEEQTIGFIWE